MKKGKINSDKNFGKRIKINKKRVCINILVVAVVIFLIMALKPTDKISDAIEADILVKVVGENIEYTVINEQMRVLTTFYYEENKLVKISCATTLEDIAAAQSMYSFYLNEARYVNVKIDEENYVVYCDYSLDALNEYKGISKRKLKNILEEI